MMRKRSWSGRFTDGDWNDVHLYTIENGQPKDMHDA